MAKKAKKRSISGATLLGRLKAAIGNSTNSPPSKSKKCMASTRMNSCACDFVQRRAILRSSIAHAVLA